ncbi:MAG: hypothetical protein HYW57_06285 [Ignavibacteriales bacterium]|nr:hypothetical protein [Ignavibacteriales bacterium]
MIGILPSPADVFVSSKDSQETSFNLLVLFHTAPYIARDAAVHADFPLITVTVNLGSGSRVYGEAFQNPGTFPRLCDTVVATVERHSSRPINLETVIAAGFSAGYGAVRKILSTRSGYSAIDAVLLLDGIHASYIPERVLAEGGQIDSLDLAAFLTLASDASQPNSEKRFLITHSEIFPGTFVSTTEATDFLLRHLGLRRNAVLQWGPMGMQLLSDTRQKRFRVLGFAGNAAPDHIDHLHALRYFLRELLSL